MAFEWLFGTPGRFEQVDLYTPAQRQFQNQMMNFTQPYGQQVGNYYSNLMSGDTEQFNKMMAPYLRDFEQQTLPGITERFAGANAMRSSGFNNSISQAYRDLATNMAAMGAGMQMQGAQGLQGLYGMGAGMATQQQFQPTYRPQTPGVLDFVAQGAGSALGGFGQAYGQGLGAQMAGGMGSAAAGASAGVPVV